MALAELKRISGEQISRALDAPQSFAARYDHYNQRSIEDRSKKFLNNNRPLVGKLSEVNELGEEVKSNETGFIQMEANIIIRDALRSLDLENGIYIGLVHPDEYIRTRAINLFQQDLQRKDQQAQGLRNALLAHTRRNIQEIIGDSSNRNTYEGNEAKTILPNILANLYVTSIVELGYAPRKEQLYAVLAIVNGRTVIGMKTGEGKTWVAAVAGLTQAILYDAGVHIVTTNDYLAQEGAKVARKFGDALGMTVGLLKTEEVNSLTSYQLAATRQAYEAHVTYATKKRYEFDFLYDRLAISNNMLRQVHNTKSENNGDTRKNKIDSTERDWWTVADACAIIDEIDSVAIDQATTPDHIEGKPLPDINIIHETEYSFKELCTHAAEIVNQLKFDQQNPYLKDADIISINGNAVLTDQGMDHLEELLRSATVGDKPALLRDIHETYYGTLSSETGEPLANMFDIFMRNALQAQCSPHGEEGSTYRLDIDEENKTFSIMLLDPYTRREMPDSFFQRGFHQALLAKHLIQFQAQGLGYDTKIQPVKAINGSITTDRYWQQYGHLNGMTGTPNDTMQPNPPIRLTSFTAGEFADLYKLDVIDIPRHELKSRRIDYTEETMFALRIAKLQAIASFIGTFYGLAEDPFETIQQFKDTIGERNAQEGRPILVTFYSQEDIEDLKYIIKKSKWYRDYNRTHRKKIFIETLLSQEDTIAEGNKIAKAGRFGRVTLANIAGRGTDIRIAKGVAKLGGLFVFGGEHGESPRIDDQERGRAGRQDDPGASRFYCSVEDKINLWAFGQGWIHDIQNGTKDGKPNPNAEPRVIKNDRGEIISHIPLTIEETESLTLEAQARLSNINIHQRSELAAAYKTINAQLDSFYHNRETILMTDNQRDNVFHLVESYLAGLIQGSNEIPPTEVGTMGVPLETRSSFSHPVIQNNTYRLNLLKIPEDDFIQNLPDYIRIQIEHEVQAVTHGQRSINDFISFFATLLTEYSVLSRENEQISQGIREQINAWIKQELLGVFDRHIGNHLTALVELQEANAFRASVGQQMTAETFRIQAYQEYRGFKYQLQRAMLQRLFRQNPPAQSIQTPPPILPIAPQLGESSDTVAIIFVQNPNK